eukprot:4559423-Pyramimonas_sp.AAC.1
MAAYEERSVDFRRRAERRRIQLAEREAARAAAEQAKAEEAAKEAAAAAKGGVKRTSVRRDSAVESETAGSDTSVMEDIPEEEDIFWGVECILAVVDTGGPEDTTKKRRRPINGYNVLGGCNEETTSADTVGNFSE